MQFAEDRAGPIGEILTRIRVALISAVDSQSDPRHWQPDLGQRRPLEGGIVEAAAYLARLEAATGADTHGHCRDRRLRLRGAGANRAGEQRDGHTE